MVAAPAEIDVTDAEQLRAVFLRAAAPGHTTIVVDMTRTRFCDSAGLSVLVRAHKRELADSGELRLVIPPDSAVFRIFTLTGLHRLIPWSDSLDEALTATPMAIIRPLRPWQPAARRAAWQAPAWRGRCKQVLKTCWRYRSPPGNPAR